MPTLKEDWNELDGIDKLGIILMAPIIVGIWVMVLLMIWGALFGVF